MSESVFLVYGGTGGIGSEVARRLTGGGDRVAIAGRDASRLSELADELSCATFEVDARDTESVEQVARTTLEKEGRLDGVVNCVGSLLLKPAHLTSDEDWRAVIDTNLGSAFAVVRAAGRVMTDGGSVVLVSSAAARTGIPNHEGIAAAKAGVIGLCRSAAATYAGRGLRFNAVAPGLVRTPMTERITSNEAAAKSSEALHALGRLGEPEDVARAICWLLAPEQSWVTGQIIGVDGGLADVRSRKG